MPHNRAFGQKLRHWRKKVERISQYEAADRLGVSQGYWSQMEKGRTPARDLLERMIETFLLPRSEWLHAAGYTAGLVAPSGPERTPTVDVTELVGEVRILAAEVRALVAENRALREVITLMERRSIER